MDVVNGPPRKTNWYVITGGPGSGKTTTVNLLSARGYKTTIEHARHYLDTQRQTGRTVEEVRRNQAQFQLGVLDMQIEPFLIASTVNTIIGQRLVRRVAPKRDSYQSTPIETQNIIATVGHLLPKTAADVARVSEDLGYKDLPLAGQSAYTLVRGIDTPQTPHLPH